MIRRKLVGLSHACVVGAAVFLTISFDTASAGVKPTWPEAPKAPPGAPNIVLIMLDDVGYGAVSTFGGPAQTPSLDQLAAQAPSPVDDPQPDALTRESNTGTMSTNLEPMP